MKEASKVNEGQKHNEFAIAIQRFATVRFGWNHWKLSAY